MAALLFDSMSLCFVSVDGHPGSIRCTRDCSGLLQSGVAEDKGRMRSRRPVEFDELQKPPVRKYLSEGRRKDESMFGKETCQSECVQFVGSTRVRGREIASRIVAASVVLRRFGNCSSYVLVS